jgi:hypothetical protein
MTDGASTRIGPSRIEAHEEAEAVAFVAQKFSEASGGLDLPTPCGYYVAIMIYLRPEELKVIEGPDGKKHTLYAPSSVQISDKYQSVTGLVVGMGDDAYRGTNADGTPRFKQPWCKIGDWVMFPRHEALLFAYGKVPMLAVPDDKIIMVITDPAKAEPIHLADRI